MNEVREAIERRLDNVIHEEVGNATICINYDIVGELTRVVEDASLVFDNSEHFENWFYDNVSDDLVWDKVKHILTNLKKQFAGDKDLVEYITETFCTEVSEVDHIISTEVIIPYRYEGLSLDDLFGEP